jgi:hypothetical protein
MHLHRRSLRHTTRMVLVVWCLALGAGVAIACLLDSPNATEHTSAPPAHHGESHAAGHADDEADPARAGCLKFCDGASQALAKPDQPLSDPGPGVVSTVHRAWNAVVASAPGGDPPLSAIRPVHLGPPIVVRPHRLAL